MASSDQSMNLSSSTGVDAAPGIAESGASVGGVQMPFADLGPEMTESEADILPLDSGTKVASQAQAGKLPSPDTSGRPGTGLEQNGSKVPPLISSSTLRAESPFAGVFGKSQGPTGKTSRERRAPVTQPASVDVIGVNPNFDVGDLFTFEDQEQNAECKKLLAAAFLRLRPDIGNLIYEKSISL